MKPSWQWFVLAAFGGIIGGIAYDLLRERYGWKVKVTR